MYHHTIAPAAPYGLPLTVKTLPQYLQGSSSISQEYHSYKVNLGQFKGTVQWMDPAEISLV